MLKRRSRNKKKSLFVFISVIFIIIPLLLLVFKTSFFKINRIEVYGGEVECVNKQQLIETSKISGKNFFFSKTDTESIKNKFLCVKDITISKIFPSKVKLGIVPRRAAVGLTTVDNYEASASSFLENMATPSASIQGETYLMDDEGVIFAKSTSPILEIPIIYTTKPELAVGKNIEANLASNSLKVLNKVKEFGLVPEYILILDNYLIIYTKPKITFRLDGEINSQLASLQLILEKAKIDSEVLEYIDLRFDKPIIKIAPKNHG